MKRRVSTGLFNPKSKIANPKLEGAVPHFPTPVRHLHSASGRKASENLRILAAIKTPTMFQATINER